MQARMKNPAVVLPGAMKALMDLTKAADQAGLPKVTVDLVLLRASQINGCSVCVDMHAKDLRKAGESDERLFAVAAWREAPYFTDAERAALALAEQVTRLADGGQVSDELWDEVADLYSETELAALIMTISTVNLWNRLNASTRQIAGAAW
ncbi:carboxymuconolactone decarboxylase family protein [Nonomuraea roseoviolacea subsp. roseoviolacea]|uniref:AhpD family alkylhydroperoxidase n=1 Tax=Nonomuraea roseoviolacea subsp. carminata TaxID=160689 RepID=A0ABT1KD05_9ACTN|nr:carboxymuconolactone decarboxylase family protein [Nonomuraea roseoviolacea]MCP2351903.1 AhpD family alkylhydroperoxidase [Nonomuraea roseoviolacea subsp. carminata]